MNNPAEKLALAVLPMRANYVSLPAHTKSSKFTSIHSSVHVRFNYESHIESRAEFKSLRDAALLEWCGLLVA